MRLLFNDSVAPIWRKWIEMCCRLGLVVSVVGCADKVEKESTDSISLSISRNFSPADDTFINSLHPDNNNGASASIYTGVDGQGGVMRGLVRFAMPLGLQGRVTVSNVKLMLTTRALGSGAAGPALLQSLQAVSEAWVQGNGVGDVSTLNTVGQTCGGSISGVTWRQSDCLDGSGTTWTTPGGTVSATVSGQATTPGVIDTVVVWDSAASGNTGMNADVQAWIDTPSNNFGWRISSSDEVTFSSAQRFYASEVGANVPSLVIAYDCKAGFEATGSDCASGDSGAGGNSSNGGGFSAGGSVGTGGTTANGEGTGGATTTRTNSSVPHEASDSGGCGCRIGGPRNPIRLPSLLSLVAMLSAASIRRLTRPTRGNRAGAGHRIATCCTR